MTDKQLALLAADILSGPNRRENCRRLSKLLRGNWSKWDRVWLACYGTRATTVAGLNGPGSAVHAHHPIAAKLREFVAN